VLQLRSPREKVSSEGRQGAGVALLLKEGLQDVKLKDERGKMEQISLLKAKREAPLPCPPALGTWVTRKTQGYPAAGFK